MTSYTARTQFANSEQRFGYDMALADRILKAEGLTFIKDGSSYRLPTHSEDQGILMAQGDMIAAKVLTMDASELTALAAELAASDLDLDDDHRWPWDDEDDWLADALAAETDWRDYVDTRNGIRLGIQMF